MSNRRKPPYRRRRTPRPLGLGAGLSAAWKWTTCPGCGKQTFPTRKLARTRARIEWPGDTALQVYECDSGSGWHYGHPRGDERERRAAERQSA